VIGAIIGETPASIQDGLGGAIVNFNQYYSTAPERLWATNIVCAVLGLAFFGVIVLVEHLVLRRAPERIA
jgi:NitT/TauT family transport system permease protein